MPGLQTCPQCSMLTMLTHCPVCRVPTLFWPSPANEPLDSIGTSPRRVEDRSVESPSRILARQRRLQAAAHNPEGIPPNSLRGDDGMGAKKADNEMTKDELLAELRLSRQHREKLMTHLETMVRANGELARELAEAKEQMVLSAGDVRDLHSTRQHIRTQEARAVNRLLRENTELKRQQQQQQRGLRQRKEEEDERLPLRIPGQPSDKSTGEQAGRCRSHSNENDAVSCVSELTADTPTNAKARATQPSQHRVDPLDTTPISIAIESVTPSVSLKHAEDSSVEVARLRQALLEREGQLQAISLRAQQAEAALQKLAERLEGVQTLAEEGGHGAYDIAAAFDVAANADERGAGAPSRSMKQQYEDLLARQGLGLYNRQYVDAEAATSSYPTSTGPTFRQSTRLASLVE